MNLLLDTHVWIWSLIAPDRIQENTLKALASEDAILHLSSISCWEVLLLVEKGRIELAARAESWLVEALRNSPVIEVPISMEIAISSRSIAVANQDPADRFIAASAKVLGLTLVTSDKKLQSCTEIEVLSA
ncbi:MAG: type II toxin-antitoxin system VapC family toxin [Gammaproteobacteria bacterium]|nr:type II toxin-antitoxin system VapC family toxin [Gammaproteobacteria bacterium]MCY4341533.1 type II toxin-antitoxin system VapC family toxin [Gammaproteobacteria bacterium]